MDWNLIITDWVAYGFGWIGLVCIGLVALRFTFALLWMIGLFGLSGYRLDCIGGGLDWIGSCIFLLDCIGLRLTW